jgi:hypothetical protein
MLGSGRAGPPLLDEAPNGRLVLRALEDELRKALVAPVGPVRLAVVAPADHALVHVDPNLEWPAARLAAVCADQELDAAVAEV